MNKIILLNKHQIEQKIKRMAYEIWEQNHDEQEIILLGLAPGGFILAKNIARYLTEISPLIVKTHKMIVDKSAPLKDEGMIIEIDLTDKPVILVDDVANSGKTLLYALRPILKQLPSKIEIAVLVNRFHKNFPITPNIIGYSVSTTLQDHIDVSFEKNRFIGAYLE